MQSANRALPDRDDDRYRRLLDACSADPPVGIAPLVSEVCHELNNPLTSIQSFAELLLLDDRPPEDREALEIVRWEAQRAARIVSELRAAARRAHAGDGERLRIPLDHAPARRRLRVLVAATDTPARAALTHSLALRGHHVEEVSDGIAALKLLGESTRPPVIDIMVAEQRLPGLSGGELLPRLRACGGGIERRLVLLADGPELPDRDPPLDDPDVPVVDSAFDLAEIVQIVEAHAGLSP